jgi:hypothetical protein
MRFKGTRGKTQRGQAALELAYQIPLMLVILFACVHLARVFYLYHILQNAVRGGAALIARTMNVNYCNPADPALAGVRNFIVYGNLQGEGTPLIPGLVPDMLQIRPERVAVGTTTVAECSCTGDQEGCDVSSGGRSPDFIVVHLGGGFPLPVSFPFVSLGTINLKVSVRMPVT